MVPVLTIINQACLTFDPITLKETTTFFLNNDLCANIGIYNIISDQKV